MQEQEIIEKAQNLRSVFLLVERPQVRRYSGGTKFKTESLSFGIYEKRK